MARTFHAPQPAHPLLSGWHGRFAPRFVPRRLRPRDAARPLAPTRALIVGGGLAGCATAWALAERGWDSLLIERGPSIARRGVGNPAGLFHGIVNGQDGSHARFHRAAALEAHTAASCAIRNHRVAGGLDGLLQLVDDDIAVDAMRACSTACDCPPAMCRPSIRARRARVPACASSVRPGSIPAAAGSRRRARPGRSSTAPGSRVEVRTRHAGGVARASGRSMARARRLRTADRRG
jgi:tRNA 5-methylaminomethyl-2-thiouridine biosynthesis bifunctional protein